MKKSLPALALLLLIFTAGCKNDEPDFSQAGTDIGGNVSGNYQPVIKGTYWKYNQEANGATTTQTQTITGATATFFNRTFYTVNSESTTLGNSLGYFYHGNDNYSMLTTAGGFNIEYVYLKDNYAVGKTWTARMTESGSLNGVAAQVVGKIVETGISKTVSGKAFKDVVHTQLAMQYDLGNGFETVQTQDYYIAKGVGIIELDSKTDSFGVTLTTTSKITNYSIK